MTTVAAAPRRAVYPTRGGRPLAEAAASGVARLRAELAALRQQ